MLINFMLIKKTCICVHHSKVNSGHVELIVIINKNVTARDTKQYIIKEN